MYRTEGSILGSKSRIIRFKASDGIILSGILSSSNSSIKKNSCIIVVHGMGSSAFSGVGLSIACFLTGRTSVFLPNNRGHGLVSGLPKIKGRRVRRVLAGTNLERFEDSIYDIKGAVDAMSRQGYRNIILCGHSTGCQKVAYYQYKRKDRRIKGIVLLAPTDDHNVFIRNLGRNSAIVQKECTIMIKTGAGNMPVQFGNGFSAQRLDSIINPKRVESRIFDYDGRLNEFGSIKIPVLALFGSKEDNTIKKVERCLNILKERSNSKRFSSIVIKGADHSFNGKEKLLAKEVRRWINCL